MRGRRTGGMVIATATLLVGCGSGQPTDDSGEAACAAPTTIVDQTTVRPGTAVRISAAGMWDGCADHFEVAVDDDDRVVSTDREEVLPLMEQVVTWTQGADVVELAVVDADENGAVEVMVPVPPQAPAGDAEIAIGPAEPVLVTVTGD